MPLVCLLANEDEDKTSFLTLTQIQTPRKLALVPPAAAHERVGPVPHVGSRVELALDVDLAGELALRVCCTNEETHLPPFPVLHLLWKMGELALSLTV